MDPVASAIPSTSTSTPSSGFSTTHTTQAPEPAPARPPLSDAALAVQRMIERRLAQSTIAGKRHAVLVELCAYHGLPTDGFNKTLAARLLAMVRSSYLFFFQILKIVLAASAGHLRRRGMLLIHCCT